LYPVVLIISATRSPEEKEDIFSGTGKNIPSVLLTMDDEPLPLGCLETAWTALIAEPINTICFIMACLFP
jgi:hypothetical protein